MSKIEEMLAPQQTDADLVFASLAGNHDAFRQIVERYQTLICSLAYSSTGNVSQSEDLAQETFVAAWKDLAELREPSKLRSWLCTIVRFRIGNHFRRQGRKPVYLAEPMEAMAASVSPEAPPSAQAINNEESVILWQSLERIPELYREPLVLFYREQQSIEKVAANLDLTEDAVKQRLSRGRKLLQEQVLTMIEGALTRTGPSQAFTLGVLAALPVSVATSAKAATVAMAAAKSGAAATGTTFAATLGVLIGPAIGLLGGYLGLRSGLKNTRTPRERAYVIRYSKIIAGAVIALTAGLLLFDFAITAWWKTHPAVVFVLGLGYTMAYAIFVFQSAWRFNREFARMREEEKAAHPDAFTKAGEGFMFCTPWEYRSRATLFGLPLVHCRTGKLPGQKIQPAIGWIACGEVAYGILFASGGVAVGGISFGAVSVGIFSYGGLGLGLFVFGGFAVGGVAMGGAAIGIIASGGFALAWHAALGGLAVAHELALGGGALAKHANDAVAREFYLRYRWLDFTQRGPDKVFWIVCFAPVFLQMLVWNWWRRKMQGHPNTRQPG